MSPTQQQPPTTPTLEYYQNDENRRAWCRAIVERMMPLYQVKTKTDLSRALGYDNPKKVAMWIQHGTIPYQTVIMCALTKGISLDYIFFGNEVAFSLDSEAKQQLQQQYVEVLASGEKMRLIEQKKPQGIDFLADALVDETQDFIANKHSSRSNKPA